ncbi:MAG: hemolysin family protein [Moraxellaceae bacterium]|nr:hemolysin family protein [Moraxellaceae bacterium]
MDILLILLLILINGLFAMSEIAIVSSRRVRLQQMAEEGDSGARAALLLSEHPTRFLSTVQIGITLIGVLSGAFGEAAITQRLIPVFRDISWLAPYAKPLATGCMVVAVTYVSLVVGELVPKRIGMQAPERIARILAPVMAGLARITMPLVMLLSRSTDFLLNTFRLNPENAPSVTQEEIKVLVAEGIESGVFEKAEQDLIENVMRLDHYQLGQVMTARADVTGVDLQDTPEEQQAVMLAARHSYLPVFNGGIDDVVGVVAVHDLFAQSLRQQELDIQAAMQFPVFVPASISPLTLLDTFRERKQHIALVVDEYGSVQGLVTLKDVMDALMGEMSTHDSDSQDPDVVRRDDGSYLLDGSLSIDRFKLLFPVELCDMEEGGRDYQTLAGLVLFLRGHVPETGEHFEWSHLHFEIVDMDRRRIDKLLVRRLSSGVV